MKIKELLQSDRVTVSCEIFPPKAGADISRIDAIVQKIAALHPNFISVTYGAGGSTSKRTLEIATKIQNTYHIPALAHLTCVSSTKEDISSMLDKMKENGIENILALRGDIPQDSDFPSPVQYHYASELIQDIKAQGDFCIGGACYPEGHVECEHKEDDIDFLKRKVDCGCDFLTTQMFFDNNVLYHFLYRVLSKKINVPIVAGVMPVINSRQIKRSCELSGTALPPRFKAIADKFSDKPKAMKQAGIAYATEQIIDLISNGVNHIHLYTMNNPEIAAEIMGNLSAIIRDEEV
ncbi:methylenetetrahydrofolate reductase [NAD(P)H] [Anaeromassilibacillus senegalensis]|uniref:methylenetetrahydrofolate reductase [NAD(P)H] n=1 Tax=Anaeromassilibacillus senegalensis TaxID=1673717 RepID=UPI000683793E|nr:methylenetetrahydrofolate reductase [NAD(P)H] [Anaeromassilibacillus senegalensis]